MAYLGVSFYSYFTTIIFNNVFFHFYPLSVCSPVSNVTSIGKMGAN